jgi:hypothetical protein
MNLVINPLIIIRSKGTQIEIINYLKWFKLDVFIKISLNNYVLLYIKYLLWHQNYQ